MYAVVDMGSNTMRLVIYELEKVRFRAILNKKEMAGLITYVKNGFLTGEGINMACQVSEEFDAVIKSMKVERVMVFATASLRDVVNTKEAAAEISQRSGYPIHVISGEEEAKLGFEGALSQIRVRDGIMADIGGGSTGIVSFFDRTVMDAFSIPIGSLNLYKEQVKGILPKAEERDAIQETVSQKLEKHGEVLMKPESRQLIGVGGSIRAIGKLYRHMYELPEDSNLMETPKLKKLYRHLTEEKSGQWQLILKLCPDRIHTLIPGFVILLTLLDRYEIETVLVSRYGLREGYLLQYGKESDRI